MSASRVCVQWRRLRGAGRKRQKNANGAGFRAIARNAAVVEEEQSTHLLVRLLLRVLHPEGHGSKAHFGDHHTRAAQGHFWQGGRRHCGCGCSRSTGKTRGGYVETSCGGTTNASAVKCGTKSVAERERGQHRRRHSVCEILDLSPGVYFRSTTSQQPAERKKKKLHKHPRKHHNDRSVPR